MNMSRASSQRGSTLALVMGFLALFLLIGITIGSINETKSKMASYHAKRTQALNIAEAGLEDALQVLLDTPTWSSGFQNKAFENGFYTVSVDTSQETTHVTSQGRIPPGGLFRSSVRGTVDVWLEPTIFTKSCASITGDLEMDNRSSCIGDIYSGSDVYIRNVNVTVAGNIDVLGNAWIPGGWRPGGGRWRARRGRGAAITGTVHAQNYPPAPSVYPFPQVSSEDYYRRQARLGTNYAGDLTISHATATLGPAYIAGELVISRSTVAVSGTIFAEGDIRIERSSTGGNATFYTPSEMIVDESTLGVSGDKYLLIGVDGIKIRDDSELNNTIVYSPSGEVSISSGSRITGAALGRLLDINNSTVTWTNVKGLDFPTTAKIPVPGTWSSR